MTPALACLLVVLSLAPAAAMDADELIAKYLDAVGGVEKLKALKSSRSTGKIQAMGMEFPFTASQKRDHKMRIDSNVQGMNFIQAYDGENGWTVNPMSGSEDPQDLPEVAEKIYSHEASIDGLFVDYKKRGYSATYIGEDEVEGTPVYHLKLDTGDGIEYDFYFEKDSLMLIKQARTITVDGNPVTEDAYYSDFKAVDGLIFPFSVEQRHGTETTSQIMMDKIELNVEIPDDYFTKPAVESESQGG
jgi:outer membrane lipoprotein-sorting protein